MLKVQAGDFACSKKCDVLIMPVFHGEEGRLCRGANFRGDCSAKIQSFIKKRKLGTESPFALVDTQDDGNLLLVFLGQRKNAGRLFLKETFASAYKHLFLVGARDIGLYCSESLLRNEGLEDAIEGISLSTYSFDKHKTKKNELFSLFIIPESKSIFTNVSKRTQKVVSYMKTVEQVRDYVNEPSNILTPDEMKRRTKAVCKLKNVKMNVIEGNELERENLNSIYAVGSGSSGGAKLICVEYSPPRAGRKIALIGKGVTFDTGGYSLKPPKMMLGMKGDMVGSAIVLSIIEMAAKTSADIKLVGLMPMAENLISSTAFKPEDIIKTHFGKTVEIESTDAEGRLLLADALSYSRKFKPDEILDMATISGSCNLALGEFISPYVSNNEAMAKKFDRASKETGETFLRLPLLKEYFRFLKSSVADMKNVSFGAGGSLITSSVFLSEFVEDIPWIHIDLAGGDFQSGTSSPIYPKGSSAFGVKTIMKYLGLI